MPHRFASSLTASQIAADEDTINVSVVRPDRWFLGDFAVVTSRDGRAFAGEVEGMDVCTGEVTIRGGGQLSSASYPPARSDATGVSAKGACATGVTPVVRARRLVVWTGGYSGSRLSTASPVPSAGSGGCLRRGRALPVPAGGVLGAEQQRLPAQRRPPLSRRRQPSRVRHPECDNIVDLVAHDKAGERILEGLLSTPAGAARGGYRRGYLPVQDNTDSAGNSYGSRRTTWSHGMRNWGG